MTAWSHRGDDPALDPTITIPPEALEAAAIDLHRAIWGSDCYSWAEIDEDTRKHFRVYARAACLAMLRAWPEVGFVRQDINTPVSYLVLPLTEPSDDK